MWSSGKSARRNIRAQSSSVKTNEAYKALQHEIANAEREAAKLEDLVLEQMMAAEDVEHRVKHAEADLKETESAVGAEKKQIEVQYNEKKKKLETATAERSQLAAKGAGRTCWNCTAGSHADTRCGDGGGPRRPVPRLRHARAAARRSVLRTETNDEVFAANLWVHSLHSGTYSPRAPAADCGRCARRRDDSLRMNKRPTLPKGAGLFGDHAPETQTHACLSSKH